jgi:ABC-type multidrug transport system fused ATPase/permease subunit
MVLENGEKKEFGSHDELIKKNGSYAKLWHSQFELQSAIL